MLTFSVNEVDFVQMMRVEKTIENNIQYFKKFNGSRWREAVNKSFMVAVQHVKSEYDTLDPYIKNLARNIMKTQVRDIPVDTVTEDGEVSYPFLKLTSTIDDSDIFCDDVEILSVYKELYLMYDEEFLKLKQLFKKDNEQFSRGEIIRNEVIRNNFFELGAKYGAEKVYSLLYEFFRMLPKYSKKIENASIKVIEMKDKEYEYLDMLPNIPLIADSKGNLYGIDKLNLSMEKDPDTFDWDVIAQTSCDIIKIDISPLMNYIYTQVYVPKGVFTKHTTWCDDAYKLTTPAGKRYVNLDRDKFINQVRSELIAHLVTNRFNTIIAISPDYVYIRPTRMMSYDTIRLILHTGKTIDLPIEIHLRKRKF